MKKSNSRKSSRNFTKLKPRQTSYALALVRTKTIPFLIGCCIFIAVVMAVVLTIVKIKVITNIQTKKSNLITPTITGSTKLQPQYYVLKEGESLWDAAEKAYGNPYEYTRLIDLNNITDPNSVNPGTKLRIR